MYKVDERPLWVWLMSKGWPRMAARSMEWVINGKALEDAQAEVSAVVHEDREAVSQEE